MKFVPKLHHELGIQHLLANPQAALWAGMGLGKTGMTLAALLELFSIGASRGALIVAPLRVCALTWPDEVAKWDEFSWMRVAHVMTHEGWKAMEQGEAQLYLISWDNLVFLSQYFLHGKRPEQLPFDVVVFDELTKAKNHESKRVNTFRAYVKKFKRRWGLTGTPAPNSYLELFAQVRLLDDGKCFGPSFSNFQQAYFDEGWNGYNYTLREGAKEKIEEKVSNLALVLLSEDWLKIKTPIVHDVEVAFPSQAKKLYEELAKELIVLTDSGATITAVNAGVLVNKLLQVLGGAVYLEQEYNERGKPLPRETVTIHDAKLKALVKLVKELSPEPVLVMCMYRHEQERVMNVLPDAVRLDSFNTPEKLKAMELAWSKRQLKQLVAHPASLGHGLNLQYGGRLTVWYSHTYSRELYDQTNARTARTGQEDTAEVYRLICPGSMDDAVIETLRFRGSEQASLQQSVKNFRRLREQNKALRV